MPIDDIYLHNNMIRIELTCIDCTPKDNFGGRHANPNITYVKDCVAIMGLKVESENLMLKIVLFRLLEEQPMVMVTAI